MSILLDVSNIVFTISSLPQTISTFKKRKELAALNPLTFIGYLAAAAGFMAADVYAGAYFGIACNVFNGSLFVWNLFWILKYRKKGLGLRVRRPLWRRT